jgi:preprotein translocase subunit SecG
VEFLLDLTFYMSTGFLALLIIMGISEVYEQEEENKDE